MITRIILAALLCVFCALPSIAGDAFYYVDNDSIPVDVSNHSIAVRFDSPPLEPDMGAFLASHPCLSGTPVPQYFRRGFYIFAIAPGCSYAEASGGLMDDWRVDRVAPVYLVPDSAELKITDLVDVQFEPQLTWDSVCALLAAYHLHVVDTNPFVHNHILAELLDTALGGPLEIGNALHRLDETVYASAEFYAEIAFWGSPLDSFFDHQYNFLNTGQTGGAPDADIDADSAWEIAGAFGDSSITVAVIDQGIAPHEDLPADRILPGWDAAGDTIPPDDIPIPDDDPTPGAKFNHGMACAGLIAASQNNLGVAGLVPNIKIRPVKFCDNLGQTTSTYLLAQAIDYAASHAVVLSNSWSYWFLIRPMPAIKEAIERATRPSADRPYSTVVVFSAGNSGNDPGRDSVRFPSCMPEVIAVGATDKNDEQWFYSCHGPALDVVAPSGDLKYGTYDFRGDLWTIDQMDTLGWNPTYTGPDDAEGNPNYTGVMGGTSGACPQVAGIAAMLLSRRPALSVRARMSSFAM